jgi:hypothetical protein
MFRINTQGPIMAPVLFGVKLAFWVKHAGRGTERHRNANPTDQESDTEKAKSVKAGSDNFNTGETEKCLVRSSRN